MPFVKCFRRIACYPSRTASTYSMNFGTLKCLGCTIWGIQGMKSWMSCMDFAGTVPTAEMPERIELAERRFVAVTGQHGYHHRVRCLSPSFLSQPGEQLLNQHRMPFPSSMYHPILTSFHLLVVKPLALDVALVLVRLQPLTLAVTTTAETTGRTCRRLMILNLMRIYLHLLYDYDCDAKLTTSWHSCCVWLLN